MERNSSEETVYVATECICDDNGVHFLCPKCKKMHNEDIDALFCCLDEAADDG